MTVTTTYQWPHDLALADARAAEDRRFWEPCEVHVAAVDDVLTRGGQKPIGAERAAGVLRLCTCFVGGYEDGLNAAYGHHVGPQLRADMISYACAIRALSIANQTREAA